MVARQPVLSIPNIPPGTDTVTAAMLYAEAGWYVLPVKRGSKSPGSVVGKRWQHQSSRDADQIAAWFAGRNYGIALHCGRSGAVVLDIDKPERLPDVIRKHLRGNPFQRTRRSAPKRGHLVFRQPPGRMIGNGTGRLGDDWGEVRGSNGVIVVAPTEHTESDGEYRWTATGPVLALPDAIAAALDDASAEDTDAATDEQIKAFFAKHRTAGHPKALQALVTMYEWPTLTGRSRHVAAVKVTVWAMEEAAAGCYSAADADSALRRVLVDSLVQQRVPSERRLTRKRALSEWQGILAWAVGKADRKTPNQLDARRAMVRRNFGESTETTASEFQTDKPTPVKAKPISLTQAHNVFRKWLGSEFDTDGLDAMLATVAVERFTDGSDPVWLLLISGSGNAKTETVQSLDGIGAIVVSSISSDAALLSATPKRERAKDATGGLLRKLGDRGVLAIKDVTSILSMDRTLRAKVLAALREIYDGRWTRDVGTDGGRTIPWTGRIVVVGAVTTAWDAAHSVISAMGDRFVLVRIDSTKHRKASGHKAIENTGSEPVMRKELAKAAAGVIAGMTDEGITLTPNEMTVLLDAADLVTLARTGVEFDYKGDVIDAHAPEMPTRFAKQLAQILRGGVSIGMTRADALRLAIRCARDSVPPLRLAIIEDLAANAGAMGTTTGDVRRRLDKPRATADRQLQALHILGLATVREDEYSANGKKRWYYTLSEGVSPGVLAL